MENNQFERDIKNLKGTFAVEGMTVSNDTIKLLKHVSQGKTTYIKAIDELKKKYIN